MSAKTPKPETPLAKAEAALTADQRKEYRQYDADAVRFSPRVASFNAGFIRGMKVAEGKRKTRAAARRK